MDNQTSDVPDNVESENTTECSNNDTSQDVPDSTSGSDSDPVLRLGRSSVPLTTRV